MPIGASWKSRSALTGYFAVIVAVAAVMGYYTLSSNAKIPDYNIDANRVAIHGYDTVAYFTDGKPLKGKSEFEHVWRDTQWHFASAGNRDLFTANPDRYAPQYGGYCALGLASGEFADADPEAWTIVDGKLYLNNTKDFRVVWRKAPEAHIGNANYNWTKNRDKLRNNL